MYYLSNKTKRKWQRSYIKKVFDNSLGKRKNYSETILNNVDLLNEKNDFLPKSLFRFYPNASANIGDIKNQRLWLSHPNSFNDPFDCNIGYDSEKYEKKCLIDLINKIGFVDKKKKKDGFTIDDLRRIERSQLGDYFFWTTKY